MIRFVVAMVSLVLERNPQKSSLGEKLTFWKPHFGDIVLSGATPISRNDKPTNQQQIAIQRLIVALNYPCTHQISVSGFESTLMKKMLFVPKLEIRLI